MPTKYWKGGSIVILQNQIAYEETILDLTCGRPTNAGPDLQPPCSHRLFKQIIRGLYYIVKVIFYFYRFQRCIYDCILIFRDLPIIEIEYWRMCSIVYFCRHIYLDAVIMCVLWLVHINLLFSFEEKFNYYGSLHYYQLYLVSVQNDNY